MNIVILHGWMQNSRDWSGLSVQLKALPQVKNVLAIDLPGFGKEPLVSNSWGVPDYADWVDKKIKKLGLKNVVLLGHSFGGRITSLLASQNPNYLKAIILSGSPSIYRPGAVTKIKNKTFKYLRGRTILKNFEHRFYSSELLDAHEKGMDIIFKKTIPFDQTENLRRIDIPALIIWGENDASVPLSVGNEIHSLIKGSLFKVINKGAHNSFVSHPYLFFGYVKNFIETL